MLPAPNCILSTALSLTLSMIATCPSAEELTDERVRAYCAAWSSGNVSEVMTFFTPDVVYEDVATGELAKGADEVRSFAAKFLAGSPGDNPGPLQMTRWGRMFRPVRSKNVANGWTRRCNYLFDSI